MKIGLVLEGGAHRTVFSCGVMDCLISAKIRADYVIGASAGITYGVSYVSEQKLRNREMLRRFVNDPRYMGWQHRLDPQNKAFYDLHFVFDVIPNELLPFDYDAYNAFTGQCLAAVTELSTGRAEYLPVPGDDPEWKVLQATCALPLLFRPVTIDGKRYADGGVADSIPYRKALDDGCDKLIVVLTRERSYRKSEERVMRLAVRHYSKRYPAYAEALATRHLRYNACIEELCELERQGKVFVIAPRNTLGVSRTDKRLDKLMALHKQGYVLTKALLPSLRTFLTETN